MASTAISGMGVSVGVVVGRGVEVSCGRGVAVGGGVSEGGTRVMVGRTARVSSAVGDASLISLGVDTAVGDALQAVKIRMVNREKPRNAFVNLLMGRL